MEFKLLSPAENGFLKEISFNEKEMRTELIERLEAYKLLTYSEEDVKLAKIDRAKLNTLKNTIEEKRKEIKKQCLAPYEEFEKKIKGIVALIDEPIGMIDSQIKIYDSKKKEEKRNLVLDIYNYSIGDLRDLLPFEKIFKNTYLNAGTSKSTIEAEINQVIDKAREDLDVIENLETEFKLQIKDVYLKTLDLGLVLKEQKRLEALQKLIEAKEQQKKVVEAQAKETEELKSTATQANKTEESKSTAAVAQVKETEELKVTAADAQAKEAEESKDTAAAAQAEELKDAELITIDFRVVTTKEKLGLLKEFLVSNQIKYGKVN